MKNPQNGTNKREIRQRLAIEAWNKFGGNITKLCKEVDIDRKTFYDWMKDSNFSTLIEEQERSLNDTIKSKLVELAINGNLTAIKFYLEHKHPEFTNKSVLEITKPIPNMKVEFIKYEGE